MTAVFLDTVGLLALWDAADQSPLTRRSTGYAAQMHLAIPPVRLNR